MEYFVSKKDLPRYIKAISKKPKFPDYFEKQCAMAREMLGCDYMYAGCPLIVSNKTSSEIEDFIKYVENYDISDEL